MKEECNLIKEITRVLFHLNDFIYSRNTNLQPHISNGVALSMKIQIIDHEIMSMGIQILWHKSLQMYKYSNIDY